MANEPIIFNESKSFGEIDIDFYGEKFTGHPITDTKVQIAGSTVCWITWSDKEAFTAELQAVISKYRI